MGESMNDDEMKLAFEQVFENVDTERADGTVTFVVSGDVNFDHIYLLEGIDADTYFGNGALHIKVER